MSVFFYVQSTVSQLRTECADYIQSQSAEFLPYLIDTHTGEQLTEGNKTPLSSERRPSCLYTSILCVLYWSYWSVLTSMQKQGDVSFFAYYKHHEMEVEKVW